VQPDAKPAGRPHLMDTISGIAPKRYRRHGVGSAFCHLILSPPSHRTCHHAAARLLPGSFGIRDHSDGRPGGFTRDRKIGKHRWVVARIVEPRT
jgi:hypothetical protein